MTKGQGTTTKQQGKHWQARSDEDERQLVAVRCAAARAAVTLNTNE